MFTIRNNEKSNERGALLMEAIALLGLMTMMSPMVVRQTAERTQEMEEVAVAGQIKDLKEALNNYITANYRDLADKNKTTRETKESVSPAQLAPYMPSSLLDGGNFRGNRLINDYKIGILVQCTAVRKKNNASCTTPGCYTLGNDGVISEDTVLGGGGDDEKLCSRFKMTGMVLSDGEEIDDKRASRIASMIGADGGYVRSNAVSTALGLENDQKILGAQGIWESDIGKYFQTEGDGKVDLTKGGRVAATTVYTTGTSGDFLYRKKINGLPDANSMFTDLDMGGNVMCDNDSIECHNINNAGGLEVINGDIVITDRSTDFVTMNKTAVNVNVSNVNMKAASAINLNGNGSKIDMNSTDMTLEKGGKITLNSTAVNIARGANSYLRLNSNGTANWVANKASVNLGSSTANLTAGTSFLNMNSSEVSLTANSKANLVLSNTSKTALLNAATVYVNGSTNYRMAIYSNAAVFGQGKNANSDLRNNNNGYNTRALFNSHQASLEYRNTSGVKVFNGSVNLGTGSTNQILDSEGIYSNVNNKGKFSLTRTQAIINFDSGSSFTFGNDGLKLNQTTARIIFNSTGTNTNISMFALNSGGSYIGLVNAGGDEASAPIKFYTDKGKIAGSFFQPEKIWNGSAWVNPDLNYAEIDFLDNGQTNSSAINNAKTRSGTGITYTKSSETGYNLHSDDSTVYTKFRVDPAFVSVMNDIKLTSRGGARLSEALPNYILKGIYILTNSYAAGKWPCEGGSECQFRMPYYSTAQLGLSSGGYEFNCVDHTNKSISQTGHNSYSHPMKGTCKYWSDSADLGDSSSNATNVLFNYYRDSNNYLACYTSAGTDGYCWAHPFMGKVPAPGYQVTTKVDCLDSLNKSNGGTCVDEVLYAQEEGVCPDGYRAVMTLTPNSFEMGRILMYNPESSVADAMVKYNFGYQDFKNSSLRAATNMLQTSTRIGVVAERINSSGDNGWKIAMGTVTPVGGGKYIWNFGGIPANSWSVTAHTYCYFNPKNFQMPNMRKVKINSGSFEPGGNEFLTPMENPAGVGN